MITRLVRMRFKPDEADRFLELYAANNAMIKGQPGCLSVQLLREAHEPTAFATWSVWQDAAALEAYRTSAFFVAFWPQVKALFRQPAEAVSFESIEG